MALRDVLRNVATFVDGNNFAGQANQVALPDLQLQTEEMRAGGMDAPVEMDMGLQAMRATLEFLTVPGAILKLFGVPDTPVTLRGALISPDGSSKGATAELRGKFIGQNPGNWQAGQQANFTATFAATYYKLTVDGDEVYEIDIERMVRRINGTDQLASIRDHLGI